MVSLGTLERRPPPFSLFLRLALPALACTSAPIRPDSRLLHTTGIMLSRRTAWTGDLIGGEGCCLLVKVTGASYPPKKPN